MAVDGEGMKDRERCAMAHGFVQEQQRPSRTSSKVSWIGVGVSADVLGFPSWPQTQRVSLQQVTSSWSGKQASTAAPISAEGSTVKFSEEDSKDLGHQIVRVSHS